MPAIVADLLAGRLTGVNVTMPLKSAAWAATGLPTPEARRSRSVNTLRAVDGVIEGHSTDTVAFMDLFQAEELGEGPLLVLGGGGSARAALAASDPERPVYVSTRSGVIPHVEGRAPVLVPWGSAVVGAVLVNATPLGMTGESLPPGVVEAAAALIDLPYGDAPTAAVRQARAADTPTVDGLEFLARQAGASFTWWTGVAVELEVLVAAARNI
jgi:shikimate dehydrogenase